MFTWFRRTDTDTPEAVSRPFECNILIDVGTNAVLTQHAYSPVITFLSESMMDTLFVFDVHIPHRKNADVLSRLTPEEYPEWSWSPTARVLTPMRSDVITEELRARAKLASAKAATMGKIMYLMSYARSGARSGVALQEEVYAKKESEARAFKESGYAEDRFFDYPYVVQYANFEGISPRQAADDILFAAKLDNELLLKTEGMRLAYFRKVAEASIDELPDIQKELAQEMSGNALE